MKKVYCSYNKCYQRRVHYERQDEERGQQLVEVPDDFKDEEKAYCSLTCSIMDGSMSLTNNSGSVKVK